MNDTPALLFCIAFLFSLTLTVLVARLIIPLLRKRAEQPIYTEGPSWHLTKSGTPTMGGISFIIGITVTLGLSSLYQYTVGYKNDAISLIITAVYALLNACVGIADDMTKLKRKQNAGLTPRAKLLLQLLLSILFLIARKAILEDNTLLMLPFGLFDFGFLYYLLSLIILVGITNCANLTDGIDGLASSVTFAIGISIFYFSFGISDNSAFISAALTAGTVGFLIFNLNPAKIFMGDTGSLFLGSLVAALAFEMENPLIAIVSGSVYVIEGISVILQVIFFKLTGKRIFKMAPIHHHLEKCGWDENKICITAIIVTLLLSSTLSTLCKS